MPQGYVSLSIPCEFLHFDTMIMQRSRIIKGDAGFEPGTSGPEVWWATNQPLHLHEPPQLHRYIIHCTKGSRSYRNYLELDLFPHTTSQNKC